jgi:hypothetical protein
MPCPFCAQENAEEVVVCRTCHRDIAIPALLKAEHRELSIKRELLRAELGKAKARLASRRRRFGLR